MPVKRKEKVLQPRTQLPALPIMTQSLRHPTLVCTPSIHTLEQSMPTWRLHNHRDVHLHPLQPLEAKEWEQTTRWALGSTACRGPPSNDIQGIPSGSHPG
nr:psoriasis susceptibility 1 candidate gene 1 protein isoform X2 [Pongo abelii]